MADTPEVPVRVRTLATRLATPTPMRRGSLSERYVKCWFPSMVVESTFGSWAA